jgi:hypothetical protein
MPAEDTQQIPVQRDRGGVRATGSQQRGTAAAGTAGEGTSLPPSAPQTRAPDQSTGHDADAEKADAIRTLARKAFGLVVGLVLLVACGFAVEHLTDWGQRWTMPLVFVLFTLVMLLASQLVVGGFSAVWAEARPSTDKR